MDHEIKIPQILYEDEDVLAYDKPSGVAVVEERNQKNTGLLGALRKISDNPQGPPYLVHRLDRGTSGVWLVAKNLPAKKDLTAQFAENKVVKQYRAYVQGVLIDTEGVITESIGKDPRRTMAMKIDEKGKQASTRYKLLRQYRRFASVRAWPLTGRTHQIRVHLSHLGHPLIYDQLYGGMAELYLSQIKPNYQKAKNRIEKPLISRLTLHCESIQLSILDRLIKIESPLPKDLIRLERNLHNYG